jgi:hypothetical protein
MRALAAAPMEAKRAWPSEQVTQICLFCTKQNDNFRSVLRTLSLLLECPFLALSFRSELRKE